MNIPNGSFFRSLTCGVALSVTIVGCGAGEDEIENATESLQAATTSAANNNETETDTSSQDPAELAAAAPGLGSSLNESTIDSAVPSVVVTLPPTPIGQTSSNTDSQTGAESVSVAASNSQSGTVPGLVSGTIFETDGTTASIGRLISIDKLRENRARIRFGFDVNRPAVLVYRELDSDEEPMTSEPQISEKWGGEGREHHQWIEDLVGGKTYLVQAMTSYDDGATWIPVEGLSIEVAVPAPPEPEPAPASIGRLIELDKLKENSARIKFGFDVNRPAMLSYKVSGSNDEAMTSEPQVSEKYGGQGREHHQWIEDLVGGKTYLVQVMTSYDSGKTWIPVEDLNIEVTVPAPEPAPASVGRMISIDKIRGNRARIRFGFDINRPAVLEYKVLGSDDEPMTSNHELTDNWGSAGREHHQWIEDLASGETYFVQVLTSYDKGTTWIPVSDLSIEVAVPDSAESLAAKAAAAAATEDTQATSEPNAGDAKTGTEASTANANADADIKDEEVLEAGAVEADTNDTTAVDVSGAKGSTIGTGSKAEAAQDSIGRMISIDKIRGNRARIRFGFDTNRPAVLEYKVLGSDDEPKTSNHELSDNWGAEGREHHQWIEDLVDGKTYHVQVMTSFDDGETWVDVDGLTIEVEVPAAPEPEPAPASVGRMISIDKVRGNRARIRFGFDINRPAVLEYKVLGSNDEPMTSNHELTDNWGGEGKEHHQWIENLVSGETYSVQVMTSYDEGKTWIPVTGLTIEVDVPDDEAESAMVAAATDTEAAAKAEAEATAKAEAEAAAKAEAEATAKAEAEAAAKAEAEATAKAEAEAAAKAEAEATAKAEAEAAAKAEAEAAAKAEAEAAAKAEAEAAQRAVGRLISVERIQGDRALIEFGFEISRPAMLTYQLLGSNDEPMTSDPQVSDKWGSEGLEHHQWIEGLSSGQTYFVQAMTSYDDGNTWVAVEGLTIEVAVPEAKVATASSQQGVFSGDLGNNEVLGTTECLEIGNTNKGFGQVTASDWRNWLTNYTYSLRPEYLETGQDGERAYFRQKLIPTSIGSHHVQAGSNLQSSRTYRLTQSLYFEPGFDWGGKNEGGKVAFGFGGGSSPSGGALRTDGFTLRLMWRGNKDGTAKMVAYSYAADRGQHLPYGDDYPFEGFEIPVGEWFDITLEVKTNSSTGVSDGSLRAWTNGQLRLHRENIGWQTSGSQPAVQKLVFTTFYGGNDTSWAPSHTTYIRFADACWAPVLNELQLDDLSQSEPEPTVLLSDAIQTPHGLVNQSISELEVMLPSEVPATNLAMFNTLDAINRSLSPEQWLDNSSITLGSSTVEELRNAVSELATIRRDASEAEYVRQQSESQSDALVYAAFMLTEKSRRVLEDQLRSFGCTPDESASYCANAYTNLDQTDEWLNRSNESGLDQEEEMSLIWQAWQSLVRASR